MSLSPYLRHYSLRNEKCHDCWNAGIGEISNMGSSRPAKMEEAYAMQVGIHDKIPSWWNNREVQSKLVAKGYTQTYGIDYQEIFTIVARMNTVRVLLSLAAHFNWQLQ